MMSTYYWNSYQHKCDPQAFGEAIETLATDGTVTPDRVVSYAAPETSPIHDGFEWDDVAAGEAWRKQQARQYLGSVRVRMTEDAQPERVTYHVKTAELGDVYVTKERIMSDASLQTLVLNQAMGVLRSAREKYRDVEALANVWNAVDQLDMDVA